MRHPEQDPPKVRDLVARTLIAIAPDKRLTEAASLMRSGRVSSLAVLDAAGIVGIVTERDITRAVADGRQPAEIHVSEYMTQSPLTIDISEKAETAATLMHLHRIRHLLVTDRGRVAGCISTRDVLRLHNTSKRLATARPW